MHKADEPRLVNKINEIVSEYIKKGTDANILHELFVEFGHDTMFVRTIIDNPNVSEKTIHLAASHDIDTIRAYVAQKINDLTVFENETTVIVASKVAQVATPKNCDVNYLLDILWERFSFKQLNSTPMSNENNRLALINIAKNEYISKKLINKALTTKFGTEIENELLVAVASRKNTSAQLMEKIWHTRNTIDDEFFYNDLMLSFAGRNDLQPHMYQTLAVFNEGMIREKLARNKTLPYDLLHKLLNDEEQFVRTSALQNIITCDAFEFKDWPVEWIEAHFDAKIENKNIIK